MNIVERAASGLPSRPAEASVLWRTVIPGARAHGLWIDPDGDRVLVSDGWGVAFSALRLRALSLEDGRELTSVRLGNAPRTMALETQGAWLAATDTKLFRLDRKSLKVTTKWTTRVPRYSDDLVVGGGYAHTANHAAPALHSIDLETGAVKRRLLENDVRVHASRGRLIAICGDGGVWSADFGLATAPKRIAQAPPVCATATDGHGGLWLSLGQGLVREPSKVFRAEPTPWLGVVADAAFNDLLSVDLGALFWDFAVSSDARRISVITVAPRGEKNAVASFRTSNYDCEGWLRAPAGFEVQRVSPDRKLGFATKPLDGEDVSAVELICFGLSRAG
ncbi:hypothetical protein [Caulobacter sp.]|uniref:hypothetical protein n=1 Tax=Caulobacter sp. TaxID=78 RepID=UPI001608BFAD